MIAVFLGAAEILAIASLVVIAWAAVSFAKTEIAILKLLRSDIPDDGKRVVTLNQEDRDAILEALVNFRRRKTVKKEAA